MLSPKQIGTICFAFLSIFVSQKSFSDNIPNNPTCDNSTLGVYSGSVALEPDWGANEIPLRWYNNNTLMDVTAAESECTYDGTLDVATAPSRTGYNFSGWTVRPERSFNTLKTATFSSSQKRWAKGEGTNNSDHCLRASGDNTSNHVSCSSDPNFFQLQQHEWKIDSNKGTIYGMAYCSAKTGSNLNNEWSGDGSNWKATKAELVSVSGSKRQCWCLVTGWVPTGEQTMYATSVPLSFVFLYDRGTSSACLSECGGGCSAYFRASSSFRKALFSTTTTNQ